MSALLGSVLLDGRLSGSVWLGGQLSGIPRAIGGDGQYTKKWIKYGVWMATGLHGRHGISLSRGLAPHVWAGPESEWCCCLHHAVSVSQGVASHGPTTQDSSSAFRLG